MADGKAVLSTDPRYAEAEKWLPGSRTGVVLRTPPPSKPVSAPVPSTLQTKPSVPDLEETPESGVFLAREDLEEMFALVRNGSKLYFIR